MQFKPHHPTHFVHMEGYSPSRCTVTMCACLIIIDFSSGTDCSESGMNIATSSMESMQGYHRWELTKSNVQDVVALGGRVGHVATSRRNACIHRFRIRWPPPAWAQLAALWKNPPQERPVVICQPFVKVQTASYHKKQCCHNRIKACNACTACKNTIWDNPQACPWYDPNTACTVATPNIEPR
jgi:hypothetical protein